MKSTKKWKSINRVWVHPVFCRSKKAPSNDVLGAGVDDTHFTHVILCSLPDQHIRSIVGTAEVISSLPSTSGSNELNNSSRKLLSDEYINGQLLESYIENITAITAVIPQRIMTIPMVPYYYIVITILTGLLQDCLHPCSNTVFPITVSSSTVELIEVRLSRHFPRTENRGRTSDDCYNRLTCEHVYRQSRKTNLCLKTFKKVMTVIRMHHTGMSVVSGGCWIFLARSSFVTKHVLTKVAHCTQSSRLSFDKV